jgi:hypothetical protein
MKADAYTKFVLTVIAACLVILVLRGVDVVPRATAAPEAAAATRIVLPPNHAIVPIKENGTMDVNITSVSGYIIYDGKVPVKAER